MLAPAPLPDADLELSLSEWRGFRRASRMADVHWIDVLYQAYLTGIIGLVVVALASGAVGDEVLSTTDRMRVLADGPGWLGGLAALALALGLRSGSRGGPLALERAEVRHVLLAPVDRTSALRVPAVRQLRFLAFVGLVVGGIAGDLAGQRVSGRSLAWIATGALGGLTLVGLFVGCALVAAGTRLPRPVASLAGVVLVGVALADGLDVLATSPTAPFGALVLWPLQLSVAGLAPVALAVGVVVVGLLQLGRISLEAAERRSSLVGQLRFAATLQDLRTVVVLRRQLAMELPRLRPWVRLPVRGATRLPVLVRGVQGLLRWPAARVARLVLLAIVVGLCLRGVWAGTTPLIVLAGVALFVAGLDSVEPLAQEVDHPSRRDATPLEAAALHLRHVPTATLTQALVGAVAALVATIPGAGQVPGGIAALAVVPIALGGLGGALVSVLSGPASISGGWSLAPPEAQGIRVAFRTAWPPALAVLGVLPVAFAQRAQEQGTSAIEGAMPWVLLMGVVFALICGWVRVRDEIGAWFRASMEVTNGPA